jgi:hypothetical protein
MKTGQPLSKSRASIMRPLSIVLIAASLMCPFAAPAHALRPNTYVASYGADSGTCSYTAPCRTFAYALSQVQAGGVVTAIDSAGNSPFTIDKAVTIMAPAGVSPSIQAAAGGTAITVSAGASDVVVLDGLTLAGANSAKYGVYFTSGAQLEVTNCVIRDFTFDGISVFPSTQASVLISNTILSNNNVGADVASINGGPIIAAINHVTATNNFSVGFNIYAAAFPVEVSIKDSTVDRNNDYGVRLNGTCPNNIATAALKRVSLNESLRPVDVGDCSHVYMSRVVQPLAPPLQYNTGVIFTGTNDTHAYSDGTNLTSAPPNSFEVWGKQ